MKTQLPVLQQQHSLVISKSINWPHSGVIHVLQGEDMGMRSLLKAEIPSSPGSSIRISGTARIIIE